MFEKLLIIAILEKDYTFKRNRYFYTYAPGHKTFLAA